MKSFALILAAYQITATAEVDHRYIDRTTRESIEKMENASCGMQSGMYGMINDPVEYKRPENMPKNCKTRLPEPKEAN